MSFSSVLASRAAATTVKASFFQTRKILNKYLKSFLHENIPSFHHEPRDRPLHTIKQFNMLLGEKIYI